MDVLKIAAVGVAACLLALQIKSVRNEYATYIAIAAGCILIFYAMKKLSVVIDTIKTLQNYISIHNVYITTLIKLIGITYIAEFCSGICKDTGHSNIASQIEVFGKLSVLAVSMPVLNSLLSMIGELFS